MIKNITYENKEAIQNDPDLPERNMITDANMNEIKEVVNNNAQELQNEIKELEEDIKANSIIEETEKEKSLYIPDASGARGRLDVLGNVEQEVTETSPSIDYPSPLKILGDNINKFDHENAEYILGYMDITTKKIIASDSTRQHYFSYLKCNPNTTYTISKEIGKSFRVGTFSQKPAVGVAYNNTVTNHTARSITITTGENDNYIGFVCFSKESGDVGTYLDMYSTVKVEKGSIATSYSPYGQGSAEIIDSNKNLYNKDNKLTNVSIDSSGSIVAGQDNYLFYFRVEENENYVFDFKTNENITTNSVYGYTKELPRVGVNATYNVISIQNLKGHIFTIPEGYKYLCMRLNYKSQWNLMQNIQLEKGTTATDPVEHQEQNYILDIQQPMLKEDYFDLDRKKEVHIWLPVALDGVQNTAAYKHKTIENAERSFFQFSVTGKGNGVTGRADSIYCNKLKAFEGTANNAINQECVWNETGQYFYISINKDRLETDNIEGMNKFLQTNPMQVYCTRAEKLELDLTESQIQVLEQLNKLRLYKGVNNIFTTEDIALLQAEYGVDIQSKINSLINAKISELNQPELLNE